MPLSFQHSINAEVPNKLHIGRETNIAAHSGATRLRRFLPASSWQRRVSSHSQPAASQGAGRRYIAFPIAHTFQGSPLSSIVQVVMLLLLGRLRLLSG